MWCGCCCQIVGQAREKRDGNKKTRQIEAGKEKHLINYITEKEESKWIKKTMEYMKVRVDRAVVIENKLKKANAVLKSLRDGQYNFLCPRAISSAGME